MANNKKDSVRKGVKRVKKMLKNSNKSPHCDKCDNIAICSALNWCVLHEKYMKQNLCQKCVDTVSESKKVVFDMKGLDKCKEFVEEKLGCSLTDEEYLAILEAQKANLQ